MAARQLAFVFISAGLMHIGRSDESCPDDKVSLIQHGSTLSLARSAKIDPITLAESQIKAALHAPKMKDGVCDESVAIKAHSPVKDAKTTLPARGFVTCCSVDISSADMFDSIVKYIKAGGRMIDTAPVYGHEATVGKAIRASGVPREKLWISGNVDTDGWRALEGSPKHWTYKSVSRSLKAMNLSYLDSVTLHAGTAQVALESPQPVGENSTKWHTLSPADHVEMWRGLIKARQHGKLRHLGVCLTSRMEIENLIKETHVRPAIVMAWLHPWMPKVQKKFVRWAQDEGFAVLAYGIFNFKNTPDSPEKRAAEKAAKRHNVTFGQLAIRWALDHGVAFMSGMYHPQYLKEDLPCNDFQLDATDSKLLEAVPEWDCNFQYVFKQFFSGCVP